MKSAASSSSGLFDLPSGDGLALVHGEERLSWSELSGQVDAMAGKVVRLGRTTFYERARRKLQVAGSAEAF